MTLAIRLRHALGGFTLDVDIRAGAGVTALFGRSGAGKTSIVNAVAGLLRPDEGHITLGPDTLLDTARGVFVPPHRRRIGYVFQDARLFPHMTVRQNLLYGRRFARGAAGPDPGHIAGLLGIGDLLDRRPGTLSGGEKQRVALGRAILAAPLLLLMDEPLAALDEARKADILPYLERLRDDLGLPILYVSHALGEVARLADTLVLVEAGRVTASGPAGDLLSDPALAPAFGLREAGGVLPARLAGTEADGLSRLDTAAGPLWLPQLDAPPGTTLRLRILAQDVMIATERPKGLSALNILPATIAAIRPGEGPGMLVRLALGPDHILARVTRRSASALQLAPGQQVFAVLKAVSVARENVFGNDPSPPAKG